MKSKIRKMSKSKRRIKGRINATVSSRVSRVFELAVELFEGDANAARRWLTTPSGDLANKPPLDFARTEIGAREVEDLMGRLEYGVFT